MAVIVVVGGCLHQLWFFLCAPKKIINTHEQVKEYREMVEAELSEICEDIINLLERDVLVQGGSDDRYAAFLGALKRAQKAME